MAQARKRAAKTRSKKKPADNSAGADHLAQYLRDADLSYTEFGDKVGCTKAHVCGLVNRKSKPSLELASRMEAKTAGAIPQASWTTRARP
jgi:hypothetical protein